MNRSYFFNIIIAVMAILVVASFSDAADKAKIIAKDGQFPMKTELFTMKKQT